MSALETIDRALAALREADCIRDTRTGFWLLPDGTHLAAGGPIEAAQRLRQRKLHRALTEPPNGRCWTR